MWRQLFSVLLLVMACSVLGQSAAVLDEPLVQARLTLLDATAESEEQKDLRIAYREALSLVQRTADFERSAKNYADSLTTAPRRDEQIRARLEATSELKPEDVQPKLRGFTLGQLEAYIANARSELSGRLAALDALDARLASQETNERQRRERIKELADQIRELPAELTPIQVDASPSPVEVQGWLVRANRLALNAEDRSLQAASASQPARYAVFRAERADLLRTQTDLEIEIQTIAERISRERLNQSKAIRQQEAVLGSQSAVLAYLATNNVSLSERSQGLGGALAELYRCRKNLQRLTAGLNEQFASARRRVEFARESTELGQILLAQLKQTRVDTDAVEDCASEESMSDLVIERITYEQQLQEMDRATRYINQLLTDFPDAADLTATEKAQAISMAQGKRKLLTEIIALQSSYIDVSGDFEAVQREQQRLTDEYMDFLSAYLLWVHSHPPLSIDSIRSMPTELGVIAEGVASLEGSFERDLRAMALVLLVLLLSFARPRLLALEQGLAARVARARSDSIIYTIAALATSAVLSLPGPLLLLALSWSIEPGEVAAAADITRLLQAFAWFLFLIVLLRNLARPDGIGTSHFDWQEENCAQAHSEITWVLHWWLPLALATGFFYQLGLATPEAGATRILALLTFGLLLRRLLRIRLGVLENDPMAGIFVSRLPLLRIILIAISIALLVIIIAGYLHSALILTGSTLNTLWLIVALILLYATLYRWSLVVRRKVRFRELVGEPGQEGDREEDRADLQDLSIAAAQLLKFLVLIVGVFGLWIVWEPILPALGVLDEITLWTSTTIEGDVTLTQELTLAGLAGTLILAAAVFYGARDLPALLELVLLQYPSVSAGGRYTITTLTSYSIFGVGFFVVLGMLGLNWSQLQWLIAALGVGIGFGLQEIVANFISGLIILFERPIRVGDVVTIGESDGTVTKIRIRATTLRDWNGKELVVPNKEFITGRLLNWSLSDSNTRIILNVGIAYGSDLEAALVLLEKVVCENPDVEDDPAPSIIMREFGNDALILTARYFVPSVEYLWSTKSTLHRAIYREFKAAGITIAFPQRDVHLDTSKPIKIEIETPR